jgi:hypothetical protein
LLIVPEGKVDSDGNRYWNATDYCCDFYRSGVDDVKYITGLVEEAAKYFAVDMKRVYLMGHSNGGFMSHRIACDRSDLVAAIVNVAGATWYDAEKCGDPEPVSVLQVHGTWDTVIYYDGLEQNAGGPNVPPIDSDACLNSECGGNLDACLNNPGCNSMVGCFAQCEANGAGGQCYQDCFDDGAPTAQFLWMETWTCGLNAGCYADPTQPTPGYASAKEGAARWAAINRCRDFVREGSPLDLINDPDDDTFPSEYVCYDGVATDLWTIRYGSHGPNFHQDWAPQVLEWLLRQEKT